MKNASRTILELKKKEDIPLKKIIPSAIWLMYKLIVSYSSHLKSNPNIKWKLEECN